MSNGEMKLFTEGTVKVGERQFTKLIGGFGDNKPVLPDKLIAELLGYAKGARAVRQRVNENIEHFTFGLDILDLKSSVPEQDTIREILKIVGYTEQSINLSKVLYVFSESGFLLFLKFAEGDKAVELYKDFIEDYFRTKAENEILKHTIEEQIELLKKEKASYLGYSFMEEDMNKKRDFFNHSELLTNQIIDLEKQLTEKLTVEKYKVYQDKYKTFMDEDGCFTFEATSKILSTKAEDSSINIRVNKISLPALLRHKGILSKQKNGKSYKNIPNSGYEKYFTTIPKKIDIRTESGEILSIDKPMTKVNKSGLDFIYNLLVKENEKIS